MMHTAYIAMGSNIGDRRATITAALDALRATDGITEVEPSTLIETDPVGGPGGQERFLNGSARVQTTLEPGTLLQLMLKIEEQLGRVRREHWGPRTIDLDLLLFDDAVIEEPGLTLPHPRMCERPFVLEPLSEIAGKVVHPVRIMSITEIRADLDNTGSD